MDRWILVKTLSCRTHVFAKHNQDCHSSPSLKENYSSTTVVVVLHRLYIKNYSNQFTPQSSCESVIRIFSG